MKPFLKTLENFPASYSASGVELFAVFPHLRIPDFFFRLQRTERTEVFHPFPSPPPPPHLSYCRQQILNARQESTDEKASRETLYSRFLNLLPDCDKFGTRSKATSPPPARSQEVGRIHCHQGETFTLLDVSTLACIQSHRWRLFAQKQFTPSGIQLGNRQEGDIYAPCCEHPRLFRLSVSRRGRKPGLACVQFHGWRFAPLLRGGPWRVSNFIGWELSFTTKSFCWHSWTEAY